MEFRRVLFRSWDFIISSLVAHHMSNAERLAFLDFMERHASRGWFVNDLYRHAFAYHGFPLLARLLRLHPIVREDGQLSIARALVRKRVCVGKTVSVILVLVGCRLFKTTK